VGWGHEFRCNHNSISGVCDTTRFRFFIRWSVRVRTFNKISGWISTFISKFTLDWPHGQDIWSVWNTLSTRIWIIVYQLTSSLLLWLVCSNDIIFQMLSLVDISLHTITKLFSIFPNILRPCYIKWFDHLVNHSINSIQIWCYRNITTERSSFKSLYLGCHRCVISKAFVESFFVIFSLAIANCSSLVRWSSEVSIYWIWVLVTY